MIVDKFSVSAEHKARLEFAYSVAFGLAEKAELPNQRETLQTAVQIMRDIKFLLEGE